MDFHASALLLFFYFCRWCATNFTMFFVVVALSPLLSDCVLFILIAVCYKYYICFFASFFSWHFLFKIKRTELRRLTRNTSSMDFFFALFNKLDIYRKLLNAKIPYMLPVKKKKFFFMCALTSVGGCWLIFFWRFFNDLFFISFLRLNQFSLYVQTERLKGATKKNIKKNCDDWMPAVSKNSFLHFIFFSLPMKFICAHKCVCVWLFIHSFFTLQRKKKRMLLCVVWRY